MVEGVGCLMARTSGRVIVLEGSEEYELVRRMAREDFADALKVAAREAGSYLDLLVDRELRGKVQSGVSTRLRPELAKACREIVRDCLVELRMHGPREAPTVEELAPDTKRPGRRAA